MPKSSTGKKSTRPTARRALTARTANKYDLYQAAVNSPEADLEFLVKTYQRMRGKKPRHLREDFCGTALLCSHWIAKGREWTAEGYDIDDEPIAWGKQHNFAPLGDAAQRMSFRQKDVREPSRRRPDVRVGANFSYWLFQTRREILGYFRAARADLAPGGIFFVDLYGGPEAMCEMQERRKIGRGVTYVWDQKQYWPGTGEYNCAIHFEFKDGTRMKNAFQYKWRFWHLTELKDILAEAGFQTIDTYFEGEDEDDPEQGNGIFERDDKGENCEAWIGYVICGR
jgi:hypothetical protein